MKIYISQQLALFGGSVLLGACMAVLYDLLRAFRLRFPRAESWLDALCCLLCAGAVFLYILHGGGELRSYILLGCVGGCLLFFCLLSDLLRPLWALWVELLVQLTLGLLFPLRLVERFLIKIATRAKNSFLFCRKWGTIWNYKWALIRIHRKRGGSGMKKKQKTVNPTKKGPRAGFVTKVLILALLTLFGTELYRLQAQVQAAEAEQQALTTQVAQQKQVNEALAQDIANGDDPALMQKIAREKLGLMNPGEKLFVHVSN